MSPDYVDCRCDSCGWIDGFRADIIGTNGKANGYCDTCDEERQFTSVWRNKTQDAVQPTAFRPDVSRDAD